MSAHIGNRTGPVSWWLSATTCTADTQPLNIITALRPAAPSAAGAPTTGAYMDFNRLGQPIAVLGAGGLERKDQDNRKRNSRSISRPSWRGTYTVGLFSEHGMGVWIPICASAAAIRCIWGQPQYRRL